MPIRFRCRNCRTTLSIATRKAGTEIQCPQCQSMVTVPNRSAESVVPTEVESIRNGSSNLPPQAATRPARPRQRTKTVAATEQLPLFERPDFESLLNAPKPAVVAVPVPAPAAVPVPVVAAEPLPIQHTNVEAIHDVVIVSRANLLVLGVVMVVLVGFAFAAGYVVAAMTLPTAAKAPAEPR
ncbi:MAG: hypothetical protein ACRCZF_08045 [Gemmataceae bacterium]